MKRFLFLLVLAVILVAPVSAGDYLMYPFTDPNGVIVDDSVDELSISTNADVLDYNSADEGRVITIARFTLDAGESTNFTFYYGGTSVEGYASYSRDLIKSTIDWGLGGYSDTFYEDYGLGWMPAGSKTVSVT